MTFSFISEASSDIESTVSVSTQVTEAVLVWGEFKEISAEKLEIASTHNSLKEFFYKRKEVSGVEVACRKKTLSREVLEVLC